MSEIYTFGSLAVALQVWSEDFSTDFVNNLDDIIQKGEQRCLRDLDLDNLDFQSTTTAISQSTGLVAKPGNLIRERDVVVQNATPAVIAILRKRSWGFIQEYGLGAPVAGVPLYYGENDPLNWLVTPLPSAAYTLLVRGIYTPPLLGDNDQTNSPAATAASQHCTANTALTLTASPYIPPANADASPGAIQVALTSTGNMSANTFTIVGLDTDGNSLTVAIAGPNAGFVQTTDFFSQVNSITPSVTDGVNLVTAGYYSQNTTWMSTRYPDLLFESCQIDACEFLKRFSARAVAQNEYNAKLADVQTQVRLLKRSDLDDLFIQRQLANGPGSNAPLPPAAPGAQAPVPGAQ
jgi:hypothetical protein